MEHLNTEVPILKVASFSDFDLIEKTKKEAENLFEKIDEFPKLKKKIEKIKIKTSFPRLILIET